MVSYLVALAVLLFFGAVLIFTKVREYISKQKEEKIFWKQRMNRVFIGERLPERRLKMLDKEIQIIILEENITLLQKKIDCIKVNDEDALSEMLFFAIQHNKLDCVKMLRKKTPLLYSMYNDKGQTSLMYAIAMDRDAIAEVIMGSMSTWYTFCDADGNTALHYAVTRKNLNIVQQLIAKDSSIRFIDRRNNDKLTAFEVAQEVKKQLEDSNGDDFATMLKIQTCMLRAGCSRKNYDDEKETKSKVMDKIVQCGTATGIALLVSESALNMTAAAAVSGPVGLGVSTGVTGAAVISGAAYLSKSIVDARRETVETNTKTKQTFCTIL